MWENGNMVIRESTKSVSLKVLPEIKGAIQRAVSRVLEHELEGVKEPSERYQNSHHVEAVMCWYLTRPIEEQDRIVVEGRAIVRRLRARKTPVHDFGPDTFPGLLEPPDDPKPPRRGGNRLIDAGDSQLPVEQRRGRLDFNPGRKK